MISFRINLDDTTRRNQFDSNLLVSFIYERNLCGLVRHIHQTYILFPYPIDSNLFVIATSQSAFVRWQDDVPFGYERLYGAMFDQLFNLQISQLSTFALLNVLMVKSVDKINQRRITVTNKCSHRYRYHFGGSYSECIQYIV